jgi:hypothetical protein
MFSITEIEMANGLSEIIFASGSYLVKRETIFQAQKNPAIQCHLEN